MRDLKCDETAFVKVCFLSNNGCTPCNVLIMFTVRLCESICAPVGRGHGWICETTGPPDRSKTPRDKKNDNKVLCLCEFVWSPPPYLVGPFSNPSIHRWGEVWAFMFPACMCYCVAHACHPVPVRACRGVCVAVCVCVYLHWQLQVNCCANLTASSLTQGRCCPPMEDFLFYWGVVWLLQFSLCVCVCVKSLFYCICGVQNAGPHNFNVLSEGQDLVLGFMSGSSM